jgi:large subunit ribosomal protein L30e
MAKASVESAEVKKLMGASRLVLGADETLKLLRQGKLARVFISTNCSPQIRADLEHACKVAGIDVVELNQTSDEIGVLCKKPFAISVVGVLA